jgi:hypothetical protein
MTRRVAIVGPHRRRAGTGPFVADCFRRSGCAVVTWDRAAASRLLEDGGRPDVDAVAICSPAETHFAYLRAALAKGLHVFCEKPIVWPADYSRSAFDELLAKLAQALDGALRDHLVVHENTQWVYTLPDFRRLTGDFAAEDVRQFRCELSPSRGTPAEMLMECSAHANSLLLELGCSGVEDPRTDFNPGVDGGGAVLDIGFRSRGASGGPVQAHYRFAQQTGQPRQAAYEVNNRRVERRVNIDDYRIFLKYGQDERAIPDPLQSSVADFLDKIAPYRGSVARISANIRMSYDLLSAYA